MALLKINPRSRMSLYDSEHDIHRNAGMSPFGGLLSMEFNRREVLGALVAILTGADEPYGTTVVGAQRLAVQVIREQHIVSKGILKQQYRPPPIFPDESEMAYALGGDWLDEFLVKGAEGHSSPAEASRRPAGNAMEVCDDLLSAHLRERVERDV